MPTGLSNNMPQRGGGGQARRMSASMRNIWLANGEYFLAKFLAIGSKDDPHIGSCDILQKNGSYDWMPAPGATSDPDGRCRLPLAMPYEVAIEQGRIPQSTTFDEYQQRIIEDKSAIPPGWSTKHQVAFYMFVYARFRVKQNTPSQDGRFKELPETEVPENISKYVVNADGRDPNRNIRYREDIFAPAYFMNGIGKDGNFRRKIIELKDQFDDTDEGADGSGLSTFDVVVYRRQGPDPTDRFNASEWTFRRVPKGVQDFNDVLSRKDAAMAEAMNRAYDELPTIYDVFDQKIRYPAVQGEAVPQRQSAPQQDYRQVPPADDRYVEERAPRELYSDERGTPREPRREPQREERREEPRQYEREEREPRQGRVTDYEPAPPVARIAPPREEYAPPAEQPSAPPRQTPPRVENEGFRRFLANN